MQDQGKYRGITILSRTKLLERIIDERIRKRIEQDLSEEQQGFERAKERLMDACIKTAGREEVGVARENDRRICGPGEGL